MKLYCLCSNDVRCGTLSRGVNFVLLVLTAAIAVVLFRGIYQAVISPFAVLDSLVRLLQCAEQKHSLHLLPPSWLRSVFSLLWLLWCSSIAPECGLYSEVICIYVLCSWELIPLNTALSSEPEHEAMSKPCGYKLSWWLLRYQWPW